MRTNPSVVSQEPLRAACLRHVGPYQQIGETFARLDPIAGAAGLFDSPPQLIAVYHDNPATVAAAELRSDAGLVIGEQVAVPDGLTEVRLAGGLYAHARHLGPYDTLPNTWARLTDFLASREGPRRGDGPGYEVYRNTPMTADPEDLVTDVYVPTA
jgi:AraC family transcriptional regulator